MKFLSNDEVVKWCRAHQLKMDSRPDLFYEDDKVHRFVVVYEHIPASRVIALAMYLASPWENESFGGGLLWIRDWGMGTDHFEDTASMIIRQMRLSKGETRPMWESPGFLFSTDELYEMHSYLLLPMLFGWDAYLVLEGKDYFVFVSRDGRVGVDCHSRSTYEKKFDEVKGWGPKELKL